MRKYAWSAILAAGILWGTMGIFVDRLTDFGFGTLHAAALRICSAAAMFAVFLVIKDKRLLKIRLCDFPGFFGLGILSILAMTCFYFLAIRNTTYSVAAILLYTAPVMVSVMSALFFREAFGVKKLAALFLATAGCVLVSGFETGGAVRPVGILFGLLSGLAYALYSIIGKALLAKYHPYTVSAYAFIFAAAGSLLVCNIQSFVRTAETVRNLPVFFVTVLCAGLVTAFLPFLLYTTGLKNAEPGKAAILASVEPLVATLCGFFRGQTLTSGTLFGIAGILSAVLILTLPQKERKE